MSNLGHLRLSCHCPRVGIACKVKEMVPIPLPQRAGLWFEAWVSGTGSNSCFSCPCEDGSSSGSGCCLLTQVCLLATIVAEGQQSAGKYQFLGRSEEEELWLLGCCWQGSYSWSPPLDRVLIWKWSYATVPIRLQPWRPNAAHLPPSHFWSASLKGSKRKTNKPKQQQKNNPKPTTQPPTSKLESQKTVVFSGWCIPGECWEGRNGNTWTLKYVNWSCQCSIQLV